MDGFLKKLLLFLAGFAALLVIAAILISFLFDPNDYRDQIAEEVKRETGRDLVIEGDLELTLFPWFAVNIGKTTLGNAPGFGDEPFLSFDEARLSIGVMPLIRGDGLKIGAVVLDAFQLNLQVDENGRNNWQDIAEHSEAEPDTAPDVEVGESAQEQDVELSIASVEITDAAVRYSDAQAGESYNLTNFNLQTGQVGGSDPIDIASNFEFELQPANIAGDFSIETALVPSEEHGIVLGDAEISAMGIDATLSVFDDLSGANVQVDAFSLKTLMARLGMEPPVTADPDVLGRIIFSGDVKLNDDAIAVSGVELVVDDTTFTGGLSVARNEAGTISINLAGDSIDVDRYMEPAAQAGQAGGGAVPVEIPVDLIRALNVRGELTLDTAQLSGLEFENVELGLNAADGDLRMHPISADFFDGSYRGDVRINASRDVPTLAVDENINGVRLGALALAMFDQQNVTGTINGRFQLGGRGQDLAAIQRSLSGSISMELVDGAFEGTDVWYELRRARALYKQEPAPEPELPARTRFSNVTATGPVRDGVFHNDELFAEMPFMQLTGKGKVDFAAAELDYRMTARILEKPEFVEGATEAELEEFTEAEIPLRVTGSLLDPSIAPDIEEMLKEEVREKVEEEIKDKLLKKLLGDG
jgi:AsmA protein